MRRSGQIAWVGGGDSGRGKWRTGIDAGEVWSRCRRTLENPELLCVAAGRGEEAWREVRWHCCGEQVWIRCIT